MMALLSRLPLAASHPTLTSFFSIIYLAMFLPACLGVYAVCHNRLKKYWLLAASYGFFWLVSGELVVYLLLSTASIYLLGLALDKLYTKRKAEVKAAEKAQRKAIKAKYQKYGQGILALGALVNIGMLLVLKYSGFFMENVNFFFGTAIPVPSYAMPIGISFFSLQAFSYLFDVYRETVSADRNPLRLALFVSFFPQIVEGPICRYGQTAQQLWEAGPIRYDNLVFGAERIAYGLLKKLVVADRLNAFVETVFDSPGKYQGGVIALAALSYTIQLYMDFSGSMDAVIGIGQIIGVTMPENFNHPFFSRTISEFWTRWHISLGGFFRDYIFYPVTMSKSMKNLTGSARKKLGNHFGPLIASSIALFCVWFCNGLWHGAAWNYIFFGMYHFVLILIGSIIAPYVKGGQQKYGIDPSRPLYRTLQTLRTGILVVIGELFFRATSLESGLFMFRRMVTDFRFDSINAELLSTLSIDWQDFFIVFVTVLIVAAVSYINERGICIRQALRQKPRALRWAVLYALILYIIIFGAYGKGYIPVDPMYANF